MKFRIGDRCHLVIVRDDDKCNAAFPVQLPNEFKDFLLCFGIQASGRLVG